MSKSWASGSTRRWRRTRAAVLARDNHTCRLMLPGCEFKASHVHHVHGRTATGDDPAHLVAACANCNLKVGDPTNQPDPQPTPRTRW